MPSFVISKPTSRILKNFSDISNSLLLAEGQTQRTIASGKSVLAIAELPEAWPQETGVYDLRSFLGALSMFDKPNVEFGDDAFSITQGKSRIKYRYSDPSTIQTPPNRTLSTDNPAVEFKLAGDVLAQLNKVASLLELPAVSFSLEAGDVVIRAADAKNPKSHAFEYTVPTENVQLHDPNVTIALTFKQEHFAMLLDGDYHVSLAGWKYGFFKHATEPVSYFVVAQV
jgi:hypothetical protein